jgi:hypothetical protein
MTPVLHLYPIGRPAGAVGPVAALGNRAFQSELAGLPKQVRADLALFELGDENPLWPAGQQSRQAGRALVQGQSAQILGLTYARRDP